MKCKIRSLEWFKMKMFIHCRPFPTSTGHPLVPQSPEWELSPPPSHSPITPRIYFSLQQIPTMPRKFRILGGGCFFLGVLGSSGSNSLLSASVCFFLC